MRSESLAELGRAIAQPDRGRFAEAEKYFSRVNATDPAFMDSAALLKAAYAHWLSARAPSSGTPSGTPSKTPGGDLAGAIKSAFGSFADFKTKFNQAATTRFGSG